MSHLTYKRTMEAARAAKRKGVDPTLVAPPVGRLRDAFMREYDRTEGPTESRQRDVDKMSESELRREVKTLREQLERKSTESGKAWEAWKDSGAFSNYECFYGTRLGKCGESNNCWECRIHKALKALVLGRRGT